MDAVAGHPSPSLRAKHLRRYANLSRGGLTSQKTGYIL